MKYHRLLRIRRKHLKITQVELSKAVGISQGLLSKIENGSLSPDFLVMMKMLGVLKVNIYFDVKKERKK